MVLWICCLAVALLGFWFPYPHPHPVVVPPGPVRAQVVEVALAEVPSSPTKPDRSSAVQPTPLPKPVAEAMKVSPPAPLVVWAVPSAQVVFPVLVQGATNAAKTMPGEGEGTQPAPDYPQTAIRRRQEGIVRIALTVGEDGRVTRAEVIEPCQWPLLNEAALGAVRFRWRFPPGPERRYEVPIHFQLRK